MIDTSFRYAQWSTNVNISGMNWQTYHEGKWYNPAEQTYSQAVDELKETIRQKVLSDHPHLIAFDKAEDIHRNDARAVWSKKINLPTDEEFYSRNDNLNLPTTIPEKINKGTIEEQIQACTTLKELETFKILANMNHILLFVFNTKLAELQKQTV